MNSAHHNTMKSCSQSLVGNSGASLTPAVQHFADSDYTFTTITVRNSGPITPNLPLSYGKCTSTCDLKSHRIISQPKGTIFDSITSPKAFRKTEYNRKIRIVPSMEQIAYKADNYPRTICAKFASSNNVVGLIGIHKNEERSRNPAKKESNKFETDSSSNGDNIESGSSLGRVFEKYNNLIKNQSSKTDFAPENAVHILQNFFIDLSSILPSYSEHLHNLGKLTRTFIENKESKATRQIPIKAPKHKVIKFNNPIKEPEVQTNVPEIQMIEEINIENKDERKLYATEVQTPKIKIPTLKYADVKTRKFKDFNEEFMENYDAFSDSWREECHKMKTISVPNNKGNTS